MKMNHAHAAVNSEDGVSAPRPTQKFDVSINESMPFRTDQVLAHFGRPNAPGQRQAACSSQATSSNGKSS
jgi:hypothetical protein